MISPNIIKFLTTLKKNNNRDWFNKNKKWYQSSREEFEVYVHCLISEIQKFDADIRFLAAKDCIFRIYRDVRFSKDKSPYKTNFGAFIVKDGRKSWNAGYYLHIEPVTPVKYAPSLMKCFRTSNFTPAQSFFLAGQAGQASHFTGQAENREPGIQVINRIW